MNMPLEIKKEIQNRLQEIEAYRSHSLFKEARTRCRELAGFIKKNPAISNRPKLIKQLSLKMQKIEAELKTFDAFSETVEMSQREQAVVHKLFTSDQGSGASADFEAATALQIFGQHAAAMKAFQALLDDDTHQLAAAKSIIRCHLGDGQFQKAVNEYLAWLKDNRLSKRALESVRAFLQAVLAKKGFEQQLPAPVVIETARPEPEIDVDEEIDDFLSIVLPYRIDRLKDGEVVLDINFQSGSLISCIVPKSEKVFVAALKPGTVFKEVQISTTDMISFCSVRLAEVSTIRVGRFAGDTTISMKVLDD